MGFFSALDASVIEACLYTEDDDAVVSMVRADYNYLVSEQMVRESIAAVRLNDVDFDASMEYN